MTARPQLIVFLKAPRLGAVKTRLARDIGTLAAWRFYRLNCRRLLRQLSQCDEFDVTLFVTPTDAAGGANPWPASFTRRAQSPGDLGHRMDRALRRADRGPVVLVGGDIPDLRLVQIRHAFRLLRRHRVVFGPAQDGGFYLVGVQRTRYPFRPFADVRWSSAHALADTLANLPAHWRVGFTDTLRDVDNLGDWLAVQADRASCSRSLGINSAKLQGL